MTAKAKIIAITLLSLLLIGGGFLVSGLFQKSEEKLFTINFTGNVLGRVRECGCSLKNYGGVYRRANFAAKDETKASLWVDYGNYFIDPNDLTKEDFRTKKRKLLSELTATLGYDAMGLSNPDKALLAELSQYALPFVSLDAQGGVQTQKIVEKGGLRFALTSIAQYDEKLVEKIESWIEGLEKPVIPIVMSTMSMENSVAIAGRLREVAIVLGHNGQLESTLAIIKNKAAFITGSETGRQAGTVQLSAEFKGKDLVSLKVLGSDYIPMDMFLDEGKVGQDMKTKIEEWEKKNGEISEI